MGIAGEYNNAKGLIMHSTLAVTEEGTPLRAFLSAPLWACVVMRRRKPRYSECDRTLHPQKVQYRVCPLSIHLSFLISCVVAMPMSVIVNLLQ